MPKKIVAAILAAGSSSRFGNPKQLARIGNKTLIDLALDALEDAGVEHIGVVLGCNMESICEHLQKRKQRTARHFHTVQNPNWRNGLSSSIHAATNFARDEHADDLMLLACDQPLVDSTLIQSLLALVQRGNDISNKNSNSDNNLKTNKNLNSNNNPHSIVACKYENSAGIPVIFPAFYFKDLLELKGDRGAKSIILKSTAPILVDFPNGAFDIDRPEDLTNCALEIRSK